MSKIELLSAKEYLNRLTNQMPEDNPYNYLERLILAEVMNFDSDAFVAYSDKYLKIDSIFEEFLDETVHFVENLKYERLFIDDIRVDRFQVAGASYLVSISFPFVHEIVFTSNLKDWIDALHEGLY